MVVRRIGGRSVLRKTWRACATACDAAALAAFPELRRWRISGVLGRREERLPWIKEPLETVTYSTIRFGILLGGATLLDRLGHGSRYGGKSTRVGGVKAGQDLICGVLQPRVWLMQLAGGFARQLAELVTVGHMRKCPKDQIRTHYVFLLQK
jgi:hypothetical protein